MRKHSNSLDWCFDCKQVKGMKSNANKKTRIYLKNHFCSLFVSCFRNKIHKLLIYKWLNSCILNLTDFLALTSMEGNNMDVQEYLDRQDRYKIIFFFADNTWNAVQVNINGWTWYLQSEGI